MGSRADLLEQAAKIPSAWPQGRGETGKLAFIKSIPNGWAAEQQTTVADYMEASSITTVDCLAFMEDTDWTDEIWGPDADKARPGEMTYPRLIS